tara:strand:+ start:57 stop:1733 length:1677 start_codon:yes stop_codon:yes gene_type:complete
MAQSVETKIEDLIGEIPDDNSTAITQWATDIAREVINVLPTEMLWQVSTTLTDSSGGTGATINIGSITEGSLAASGTVLTVTAGGSSYGSDPTVVINKSGGGLSGGSGAKIRAVSNGSAVISAYIVSSGTGYAPTDVAAVVGDEGIAATTAKFLYAHKSGYRAIEIDAANRQRAEDSDSIYKATTNSPVFYRESGRIYVEPTGGSVVVVSYPTINYNDSDVTGVPDDVKHLIIMGAAVKGRLFQLDNLRRSVDNEVAPNYSELSLSLLPIPSIGDLSVLESAPTLALEAAPVISNLSITATPPVAPSTPSFATTLVNMGEVTAPSYDAPALVVSYANAVTQIETNEDVELANAELAKISTQLNEYKSTVENKLNIFNEQSSKYQAEIGIATQEAQMSQAKDFQEYSSKLEKYSGEVAVYQQLVNKEVSEYTTNNLQKDLSIWQQKRNDDMQAYGLKLDLYKTNIATEKEVYAINEIQKEIGLWQSEQTQKIQKYGADLQQATTKFGSEFQKYQTSLSNIFQKHQQMVQELQVLDAQYQRGLQTFVSSYQEPVQNAKGV